ncbi:nucleotide disphospho-sugar-binding domain-containing protein [Pseudonocardia acaciae]|uniref:nucleotide disphospho-sugar-binding domain-containing protein n=1 Tax=Pseudonocardia acaciae TaxID=551276 RepID=UPI00048CE06A|nr:nucleotide disphospho-sugar-binding domain-containing protein [Pseudonocardia acaciae]
MKLLFALGPAYGLALPLVPLAWAARAAGHEVLVATTSEMTTVVAGAGLGVTDVFPDRDVWDELMRGLAGKIKAGGNGAPKSPFGLFTSTMTGGTIDAGRRFGADLVVYSSDHRAGALASVALGRPALEVGNRVSWSMRDAEFAERALSFADDDVVAELRAELGIPPGEPALVARIDPRPPSMGGLTGEEPDRHDHVPWWSMRFVPYNGGAVLPDWTQRAPDKPRVCVTLGTVVPALSGTSSLAVVLEALGGMDVEVVLAEGSADLGELGDSLPANVRRVGFLPLSGFLPGCSLIVHHGGSGTTAAPLHYGVPQLVLPSFADNPMSAERVVARGVGLSHDPAAIDVPTVRALAQRLLDEPAFARAAAEVRAEMATQPSPSTVIDRLTAALPATRA